MTSSEITDVAWRQALDWIMREHDSSFDNVARTELREWLEGDLVHQKAYHQARTIWLITGLIPTADELSSSPPDNN